MFILIDNYDSFTYNLYHYLGELGAEIEVHRNDKITVDEVLAKHPQGIILSPGPCDPDKAGICLDLVKAAAKEKIRLPTDWYAAVNLFEASDVLRDYLGARFVEMFVSVKRTEQARFAEVVTQLDYDWSLRNA